MITARTARLNAARTTSTAEDTMTDPVNTDALNTAWEKYAALNNIHPHSIERDTFEQGWDAAADEVDRLRDRLHHVEHWTVPEAIRTWQKERAQASRLRAAIEHAPHARTCYYEQTAHWDDPKACDCWKAGAL